jgi:putative hemolysin
MSSDPEPTNFISQLILIAILTLVNAFFASAEMAIVSLNRNRIRMLAEEGDKKAKLIEKLLEEPTKFLSTIQVGITLAGFFSSAAAATGISGQLGEVLAAYHVPYGQQISLVVVTILLSYVTLVFGELFPKRVALQKSEAIAMFSVKPILWVSKLANPFIKLLSVSTSLLMKLVGMNASDLEEKVSREEIRSLVEVGQEHGVLNETEKEMINSIFEFDDKVAKEVMTPRTKAYLINIEKPLEEYVDELLEEKYSRVPVFEGDNDNIIGILYMKDFMLEAKRVGFEQVDIQSLLQPAYFVSERKNIDELFKELQRLKKHMCILIDEYGGFSGIVTIEDLIEEVMGDIDDEHDENEPEFVQIKSDEWSVSGLLAVEKLCHQLNLDIELDDDSRDYDTVGGLITHWMGRIPEVADYFELESHNMKFVVTSVEDKRVERVKVVKMFESVEK